MANLEATQRETWKNALRDCAAPWIALAIDGETRSQAEKMDGMPGLIDWYLHGQVSSLLARKKLDQEDFCLVPAAPGRPTSFLIYQYGASPSASAFVDRLRQLQVKEVCLAESTFPEDFLAKLKQHLKKEGVRCIKLEP